MKRVRGIGSVVAGAAASMIATCGGPSAQAAEIEVTYGATLNVGTVEEPASLQSLPLPAGTFFTLAAEFDTGTEDQWNTGAYIYGPSAATIVIGIPGAALETYRALAPVDILLSDPSWIGSGGPGPYSAGFISLSSRGDGSLQSVFESSTAAFDAGNPSSTLLYDYASSFEFTGRPFVVSVDDLGPLGSGMDVLSVFDNSVSNVTTSIGIVPELSTWAMTIAGFAALGLADIRTRYKVDPARV